MENCCRSIQYLANTTSGLMTPCPSSSYWAWTNCFWLLCTVHLEVITVKINYLSGFFRKSRPNAPATSLSLIFALFLAPFWSPPGGKTFDPDFHQCRHNVSLILCAKRYAEWFAKDKTHFYMLGPEVNHDVTSLQSQSTDCQTTTPTGPIGT